MHVRAPEDCVLQDCAPEVRLLHARSPEVRLLHVRAPEVRVLHVRAPEVCVFHVRVLELRSYKMGTYKICLCKIKTAPLYSGQVTVVQIQTEFLQSFQRDAFWGAAADDGKGQLDILAGFAFMRPFRHWRIFADIGGQNLHNLEMYIGVFLGHAFKGKDRADADFDIWDGTFL